MPKRYFDEESRSKPGVISENLRMALNLHRDKLPIWIYKMRVLGYPPGWLQRADITNTTITLIDGNVKSKDSMDLEEGEAIDEETKATYNPDSLVEFPGFNAPVPYGVNDHCDLLGMPPMQPYQQLNFAKIGMTTPKPVPYKRLKLSSSGNKFEKSISQKPNSSENLSIKNKSSLSEESIQISKTGISQTKSTYSESNQKVKEQSVEVKQSSEIITSQNQKNFETSDDKLNQKTTEDEILKCAANEDEAKNEFSSLKLIAMGSPVPPTTGAKKPPLEKFAKGMGNLIYFQNLPTSTGVFEKMRGVIHKIRDKLSQ